MFMNNNEVLFKVYKIITMNDGGVIARFTNTKEAQMACDWLNNNVFKKKYTKIDVEPITNATYNNYDPKNLDNKNFSSFDEFYAYLNNKLEERKNRYKLKSHKMAFVKINNFWWELDLNTPLNRATIYNYMGGKQTDFNLTNKQIVEADDWINLDWKGTEIFDEKYNTGWLSPDGNFYGCSYEAHAMQARLLHGTHEGELEKNGWIKIRRDLTKPSQITALLPYNSKTGVIKPTPRQIEYLKNSDINNLDEVEYLIRYSMAVDSKER